MQSLNNKSLDKTNEYVKKLQEDGYCFIPDLISENECKNYKLLLEDHFSKYSQKYAKSGDNSAESLANKRGEKVVYNLHNKNYSWFKLFENKTIISVLDITLNEGSYKNSEGYYLNNIFYDRLFS